MTPRQLMEARRLPTPTKTSANQIHYNTGWGNPAPSWTIMGLMLALAVDYDGEPQQMTRLARGLGPNPQFIEWMMGFAEDWTDLESQHSVTPSSPKSPPKQGGVCSS